MATQDSFDVTSQQGVWGSDPWGRHQQRWHDGSRWTEHVADGGVTAIDPPDGDPPPPGQYGWSPGSGGQWQGTPAPARLSFLGAVARCFTNYVNFNDRAARSEYWWFVVFYVVVIGGLVGLEAAVVGSETAGMMVGIAWLLLVLPQLAVTARRLHDTGKSGWLQLISIVPLVGPILLIVWLASRGEPAPNRWGPPPGTAVEALPTTAAPVA